MRFTQDFDSATFQRPQEPRPETFCIQRTFDAYELEQARRIGVSVLDQAKRWAAHELANHIADHCKWFDPGSAWFDNRSKTFRIELTINDRGSYEHMIPRAKEEGRRLGREQTKKSLPYGLADACSEFYE